MIAKFPTVSHDVISSVLIEVWQGVQLFDVPKHEQMMLIEITTVERPKRLPGESEAGPVRLDPERHYRAKQTKD